MSRAGGQSRRPRRLARFAGRHRFHWGRAVEPLEPRCLLAAQPLITEFMAVNDGALEDGDGNSPDWIEIHNAGDVPLDLAGYRLTDSAQELSRWVFPSVELAPGQYRVIFASGQDADDYVDAAGNLHTNFALKGEGEYLALVAPTGRSCRSLARPAPTTCRSCPTSRTELPSK